MGFNSGFKGLMTNRPALFHLRISDCYLKSMTRFFFMTDRCMYRNNILLFAVYVYWTSFPFGSGFICKFSFRRCSAFSCRHFFWSFRWLLPVASESLLFRVCLQIHWFIMFLLKWKNRTWKQFILCLNIFAVWSQDRVLIVKTEICVLHSGYNFVYKTVGFVE